MSAKLRVLTVTHNYPTERHPFSGLFIHRLLLATRQNDIDHSVVYLRLNPRFAGYCKRNLDGIEVHDIGWLRAFPLVRRLVRDHDLVIAHWLYPAGVTVLAAGAKSKILHTHGSDIRRLKKIPLGLTLARWLARRFDVFLPVSNYLRDLMRGVESEVFPMPIEVELFGYVAPARTDSPPKYLFLGLLSKQKNIGAAILAMKQVDGELFIHGEGPEKQRLQQIVEQNDLSKRVHVLPLIPRERVAEEYHSATVTVNPSIEEGFGLVVVESLMCGRPVVIGTGNVFDHPAVVRCTNPENIESLASCMTKAADLQVSREQAESLREEFSMTASARKYRSILEQVGNRR